MCFGCYVWRETTAASYRAYISGNQLLGGGEAGTGAMDEGNGRAGTETGPGNCPIFVICTMPIQIRRAEKADCARLMELVRELAEYEKAPEQVTVSLEHFEQSGFGPNPVWWAFVACETDANGSEMIAGFALYYIRYSTWKGQRLYLEDILVTQAMRGHGIGKLLFDRLIEEAREKQYSAVVWQVLDWNEPAINFYKKYNTVFEAEWLNCRLEL
jgi:GNAT superfamily N-acetyltransferase